MAKTPQQVIEGIRKLNDDIADAQAFFNAVSNAVSSQSVRVFENGGVGVNGSKISYRAGKLYVNPNSPNNPRKFPVRGKNSNTTVFKNGNPRMTSFFSSYADYKKTIGQQSYVNLILFGNLQRAYGTGIELKKTSSGMSVFHSIRIDESNPLGKINGLISKYPWAFKPIQKERDEFTRDIENYLKDAIRRAAL